MCSTHPNNLKDLEQALEAVFNIFHCHSRQISFLLTHVIPILVQVSKEANTQTKHFFMDAFTKISSIAGKDINPYIVEISQVLSLKDAPILLLMDMLKLMKELAQSSCIELMNANPSLLHESIKILETQTDTAIIEKTIEFIECLKLKIDQYLYIAIPSLLKIVSDHPAAHIRRQAIRVISVFCNKGQNPHILDYVARIVQCFLELLRYEPGDLLTDIFDTLGEMVQNLGNSFAVYIPQIEAIMASKRISHGRYEKAVQDLITGNDIVEPNFVRPRMSTFHSHTQLKGVGPAYRESRVPTQTRKQEMKVDQLLQVCNTSAKYTKEEWKDWIRKFASELLHQAPAPALRECQGIETYNIALELFNSSFVSCWSELFDEQKTTMIKALESAFESETIPTEVLQVLLNLAEFMEHDDHKLFDARTLGKLAHKCKAYAKALHYKEVEFYTSAPNSEIIEALISHNNLLHQHEAAYGIRVFARKKGWGDLSQSWFQEFHRWQDAEELHEAVNERLIFDPAASNNEDLTVFRMKCLKALSDWSKLMSLAETKWRTFAYEKTRKEVAAYAATSAWNLGKWEELQKYTEEMDQGLFDCNFYKAILAIHDDNYALSRRYLERAWDVVDSKLPGLLRESYSRAYPVVVETQQLCDLEEIIGFKSEEETQEQKTDLLTLWNARLKGSQQSIDIWEKILSFRPLVIAPEEDLDTWMHFAELCMQNGQMRLAGETLETLFLRAKHDSASESQVSSHIYFDMYSKRDDSLHPASLCFLYLKYLHLKGQKELAVTNLAAFVREQEGQTGERTALSGYYLELAKWKKEGMNQQSEGLTEVLQCVEQAKQCNPHSHEAWQKWGLINFEAISLYERKLSASPPAEQAKIQDQIALHANNALEGFIHSVATDSQSVSGLKLQDILRLITLWFKHGGNEVIYAKLKQSFDMINVDVWLQVVPQIIARGSTHNTYLSGLILELLKKVSKNHPHYLVYYLSMAAKVGSYIDFQ